MLGRFWDRDVWNPQSGPHTRTYLSLNWVSALSLGLITQWSPMWHAWLKQGKNGDQWWVVAPKQTQGVQNLAPYTLSSLDQLPFIGERSRDAATALASPARSLRWNCLISQTKSRTMFREILKASLTFLYFTHLHSCFEGLLVVVFPRVLRLSFHIFPLPPRCAKWSAESLWSLFPGSEEC